MLGTRPSRMWCANIRRIDPASATRPVASVSPSREIIVSRPQSVNQWYPAINVHASSPAIRARVILVAACGADHEGVGREHELGGGALTRGRRRGIEQAVAALGLGGERL